MADAMRFASLSTRVGQLDELNMTKDIKNPQKYPEIKNYLLKRQEDMKKEGRTLENPFNKAAIVKPIWLSGKICTNCLKKKDEASCTNLFKCSRCKSVYYCDATCQKADWKEHKKICKVIIIPESMKA